MKTGQTEVLWLLFYGTASPDPDEFRLKLPNSSWHFASIWRSLITSSSQGGAKHRLAMSTRNPILLNIRPSRRSSHHISGQMAWRSWNIYQLQQSNGRRGPAARCYNRRQTNARHCWQPCNVLTSSRQRCSSQAASENSDSLKHSALDVHSELRIV